MAGDFVHYWPVRALSRLNEGLWRGNLRQAQGGDEVLPPIWFHDVRLVRRHSQHAAQCGFRTHRLVRGRLEPARASRGPVGIPASHESAVARGSRQARHYPAGGEARCTAGTAHTATVGRRRDTSTCGNSATDTAAITAIAIASGDRHRSAGAQLGNTAPAAPGRPCGNASASPSPTANAPPGRD